MAQSAPAILPYQPMKTSFGEFFWRISACHIITYMIAGIFAYTLLDYKTLFETGALASFMRPVSSPWVAAGPALQVFRGLIFAVVLYPFRRVFLEEKRGWLKLWGLFVGLAILSTAGPTPGSVEGLIYTKVPLLGHLRGLPEVVLQTLAVSVLLTTWYRFPRKAWTVVMAVAVGLVYLMSLAALFQPRPSAFQ